MTLAHDATLQNMSTDEVLSHIEPVMHLVATPLDWELYNRLRDSMDAIRELESRLAEYEDKDENSDDHPAIHYAMYGRSKSA